MTFYHNHIETSSLPGVCQDNCSSPGMPCRETENFFGTTADSYKSNAGYIRRPTDPFSTRTIQYNMFKSLLTLALTALFVQSVSAQNLGQACE